MKKYKEDILNFLLFGTMILSTVISKNVNSLDELWVFNMARNVANGLLPYKDFSIITTPGLPILCGTILKLFGTEMFLMRILAVIVDTVIAFMIYKILKLFNIDKYFVTLITLIIAVLFMHSFCIDYNFMILMIALICLYFELKRYYKTEDIFDYNIKIEMLLGILSGISILMKQTTGICFAITFVCYKLLAVRSKYEFKKFIKIFITRLTAVIIPVILLILYLTHNNIMDYFIDYAIIGIKEFSNDVPYIYLLKSEVWYLAIFVPIIIISSFIILLKRKEDVLLILFAYSISTIIVVYPIADEIHFLIAGAIGIITGIYMIVKLYESKIKCKIDEKDILKSTNLIKVFTIIFIIIIILSSMARLILFFSNYNKYNNLKNFKYIPVSKHLEKQIVTVGEYIKATEEEIYILDASAAVYMIPLDRYNKNYDMFLRGNLGAAGSQGIIEDLQKKENAVLLIQKDESLINWQTPMDIVRYIKDNYVKYGEIEKFDIYKRNE